MYYEYDSSPIFYPDFFLFASKRFFKILIKEIFLYLFSKH